MNLVSLSSLFYVQYGVNLELNAMTPDPDGIAFVGRSERNNGITGRVKKLPNVTPLPAGTLTVAGGGSVLATFVQMEPYYSGRDLYYLTPRVPMTLSQKVYYAVCIRANRYRYNYGRQANRTLKDIEVPSMDSIPSWVEEDRGGDLFQAMLSTIETMQTKLDEAAQAMPAPAEAPAAAIPQDDLEPAGPPVAKPKRARKSAPAAPAAAPTTAPIAPDLSAAPALGDD